jgi:(p)ppGpp synthase/HD superfamily hydrolase
MTTPTLTPLTAQFEAALLYATKLHAGQRRKDPRVPYIAHLLSVAALVLEDGGNEEEAIAALLHDAIEDQGGLKTRNEIQRQFGDRIVAIVESCTESETFPKPPWLERKQRYIEQLRQASCSARRVSLADKLHNARSLLASLHQEGDRIWQHFHGGKAQTLWFYDALLQVYRSTGADFMTEEFARVITEIAKR